MAFELVRTIGDDTRPFETILGTDAEAYDRHQIVTLASGRLTGAGVDSTGTQKFVTISAQAAEATAVTPIPVIRLDGDMEFRTQSSGVIAVTAIGDSYTLDTDQTGITTTTTNGVFEITGTDGANPSNVTGLFKQV